MKRGRSWPRGPLTCVNGGEECKLTMDPLTASTIKRWLSQVLGGTVGGMVRGGVLDYLVCGSVVTGARSIGWSDISLIRETFKGQDFCSSHHHPRSAPPKEVRNYG